MTIMEQFAKRYLPSRYPGRHFSNVQSYDGCGDYLIHEHNGKRGSELEILRTARIDPRVLGMRPGEAEYREVSRLLDAVVDTRNATERLPWQLFWLPP